MSDLTGKTFAEIFPKLLQDPGDGSIQKSDGTEGASGKANIEGGNTFSGVQDFTGGISLDGADLSETIQGKSNEFTKPNRFDYKDPFFQQTGIIWDSTSNPSLSSGTIDTSPTGVQWGSVSSPTLTVI